MTKNPYVLIPIILFMTSCKTGSVNSHSLSGSDTVYTKVEGSFFGCEEGQRTGCKVKEDNLIAKRLTWGTGETDLEQRPLDAKWLVRYDLSCYTRDFRSNLKVKAGVTDQGEFLYHNAFGISNDDPKGVIDVTGTSDLVVVDTDPINSGSRFYSKNCNLLFEYTVEPTLHEASNMADEADDIADILHTKADIWGLLKDLTHYVKTSLFDPAAPATLQNMIRNLEFSGSPIKRKMAKSLRSVVFGTGCNPQGEQCELQGAEQISESLSSLSAAVESDLKEKIVEADAMLGILKHWHQIVKDNVEEAKRRLECGLSREDIAPLSDEASHKVDLTTCEG